MSGLYIVYALKEADNSALVHYVGRTFTGHMTVEERLAQRLENHWCGRSCGGAKNAWLRTLSARPVIASLGLVRTPSRVRSNLTPPVAYDLERFWIQSLARDGHPLTNVAHAPPREERFRAAG
jgi:hypothetical protein